MPQNSNTPDDSARISQRFALHGRFPLQVDETCVPVVLLDDLTADTSIPPDFGARPGQQRATVAGTSQGDDTLASAFLFRAGAGTDRPPAQLLEVLLHTPLFAPGAGQINVIEVGTTGAPGGLIGTFPGTWSARSPGRPRGVLDLFSVAGALPASSTRILALPAAGAQQQWMRLDLSIRGGAGPIVEREIHFTPVAYVWAAGVVTRSLLVGAWSMSLRWRE